jgi:hypothetical protein
MADHPIDLLQQHLNTVHDPRVKRTREHDLSAILSIAVCAVVGGADSWVDISSLAMPSASGLSAG